MCNFLIKETLKGPFELFYYETDWNMKMSLHSQIMNVVYIKPFEYLNQLPGKLRNI